ncbi:hypothetical protein [Ruania halotolerans]|uniref:hypothetical protein n=1 Tax=Ruania halotolerans TaxID=2897773 RepID=UPI001E641DF3|nr:hypothetical protein [Ruania halotolerans]UFU08250.1 hypothetical protein LQF10_09215 [Ruania halotolerans]
MMPSVIGGAAIIAMDSMFSPATAVHQWVLVAYSVMLWVLVPTIAAAAVVAGVSAHRKVVMTPLHSALLFGAAAALWMTFGVSNVEGSVYGVVLGAGAIVAGMVFRRGEDRRSATGHAAIVVVAAAMLLKVAVPTISSALREALTALGMLVM